MVTPDEPKSSAQPNDADFEATDGGWDPYVTALMLGAAQGSAAATDPEDDSVPVMSFSRTQAKWGK